MAAHTNVCVIGLGSMGMGAARACLGGPEHLGR